MSLLRLNQGTRQYFHWLLVPLCLLGCSAAGEPDGNRSLFASGGQRSTSAGSGGVELTPDHSFAGSHAGGSASAAGGSASSAGGSAESALAGSNSIAMGGLGGTGGAPNAQTSCANRPGALRGKSNQALTAGGLSRTFVHYAPATLKASQPAPVVIVAHGWLQSGQAMYDLTQYQKVADREGFVLMYPDGEPNSVGPWNIGDGACPSTLLVLPTATGDDQAFVDAMLDFAEADQCIDHRHIFVTGFSMGGYFTNQTGCLRSNIAAIAPHSGGSHDLSACPVVHKPVILFHGLKDGLIPSMCGLEARDRWVKHNGCGSDVDTVAVKGGHCEYSKGCPKDGQVALCLFDGMDHGWAGGQGAYGFPDYEPASELGWAFFKKYAW